MFRLPMFGFTCLSFLMLLVIVAIATWLVFRSQEPGKTRLSGCAGCAVGLALLLIAGLGALGCTAVALVSAPDELVRRGPFERFEFRWPKERGADAGADRWRDGPFAEGSAAILRLTLREGGSATDVAGRVSSWLREETDRDLSIRIRTVTTERGEREVIEFALPLSQAELEEVRDDLERAFPRLSIPSGVEAEIRAHDER